MSLEAQQDLAQREIEKPDRLHHDPTYNAARKQLHEATDERTVRHLHTILVIREAQIKEENGDLH